MKILLISTFYPEPDNKKLVQDTSVVHYFAKEWAKQGNDVTVLHLYAHNFKNIFHYNPIKYGKIQQMKNLDGVKLFLMENQFFVRNAKHYTIFQRRRIFKSINNFFDKQMPEYNPDVVVVHFPSHFVGIVENLKFNCKKVATFHQTDLNTLSTDKKSFICVQNTYDKFAARSHKIMREMRKIGYDVNFVANSGIDSNVIQNFDNIKCKKFNTRKLSIIYAGSFIERKNVETIIDALSIIKNKIDFCFTIIGDGTRRIFLEKLAIEKSIYDRCLFLGKKTRDEVIDYMNKSDLFVMVSKNETLGLTYMEAMSQGCISIGSKNEGIDGIIEDGENGFLITAGDSKKLASLIEKIYNLDKKEKLKIINNSIITIKKMTSEEVAKDYLNFIRL